MSKNGIADLLYKYRNSGTRYSCYRFAPRHEVLRAISGKYKLSLRPEDAVPPRWLEGWDGKMKLTRFLARKGFKQDVLSELGKMRTLEYEITTSYKDILRVSMSRHYYSCMAPNDELSDRVKEYLHMNNVALLVVRDDGGDFVLRSLLYLVRRHNRYLLIFSSAYGNSPFLQIMDDVDKRFGIQLACFERFARWRHRSPVWVPQVVRNNSESVGDISSKSGKKRFVRVYFSHNSQLYADAHVAKWSKYTGYLGTGKEKLSKAEVALYEKAQQGAEDKRWKK